MKSDARFVLGVLHNLWISDLYKELNELDVCDGFPFCNCPRENELPLGEYYSHPCSLLKIQMCLICFRAGDP